jgi:acetoacetate decarboxylase
LTAAPTDPRVQVSPSTFTGLPLRQPLYGPGPYDYTNGMWLTVTYEADEQALRETLPSDLELRGNTVTMIFTVWPEVTGMGPHSFTMPSLDVRFGDTDGRFIPYLYTSTDASLACYREVQGWPAMLGSTQITVAKGEVRASVTRNGREIISAEASVGGEPITSLGLPTPLFLYKEIPSIDTTGTDVAKYVVTTSLLTNVDLRAGTGSLQFPDPGAEAIARLAPQRVLGAAFGSLDDHYPQTIDTVGAG